MESRRNVLSSATERCPAINFTRVGSILCAALFAMGLSGFASAQLPLFLAHKFVDSRANGNGNIGVTQDEKSLNYYVLDFSNTNTVHEFDRTGKALGQFPTSGCTPAAKSPNGVTTDTVTNTLWIVDNNSGGSVTHTDRAGKCLGGFSLPSTTNAVGITFNRLTKTLFVSRSSGVDEYDLTGKQLTGGFSFKPSSGSAILSGIGWDLKSGNFLITQTSGNRIFEVDKTGKLVSTTSLATFGIRNTQGLHVSLLTNQIIVVDNTLSTTFVFDRTAQTLSADVSEILIANGGTQTLSLSAGAAMANKSYWIFGSITGTSPGIALNGLSIPLNPDPYTDLVIASTNTTIFTNFRGTLSATGTATARLNVPKGLPALSVTLHHAFIAFDPAKWHLASNAVFLRVK